MSIFQSLLGKLAEFTVTKVIAKFQSLYGIREEIDNLSQELKYVQAFIEDADRKHIIYQTQTSWVKHVIDIAYDIEDAIDVFFLECPLNPPSIMGHLRDIPFLCKFKTEVNRIKVKISEIKMYRDDNEISTLGCPRASLGRKQKISSTSGADTSVKNKRPKHDVGLMLYPIDDGTKSPAVRRRAVRQIQTFTANPTDKKRDRSLKLAQYKLDQTEESSSKLRYTPCCGSEEQLPICTAEEQHPIDVPEIIGFARDIDEVVKCLCDKEKRGRAVVSIVGPGGIGKTTLARKACNRYNIIDHPIPCVLNYCLSNLTT